MDFKTIAIVVDGTSTNMKMIKEMCGLPKRPMGSLMTFSLHICIELTQQRLIPTTYSLVPRPFFPIIEHEGEGGKTAWYSLHGW